MNPFEKPFSGGPEEAKRLFDKMRKNVDEGIVEEVPIPPEFDTPPAALDDAPKPASEPKIEAKKPEAKERVQPPAAPVPDFKSGAEAMAEWQRRQEEAEDERNRRLEGGA